MRDYQVMSLIRDIARARRDGTRNVRRRAEKALAAIGRGDIGGAFRSWQGITPRIRTIRYGADVIHPGGRVRGGGDWRR